MGGVQDERYGDEIADQADQIHHAAFSEVGERCAVGVLGNSVDVQELAAEVVHRRLVLAHHPRTGTARQRVRGLLRQAGGDSERIVHLPFELLRELARHDEHRKLAQAALERALVAQVLADLLQAPHELGAAQERNERPAHAASRPRSELGRRSSLLFGHRFGGKRRHAIVHG